MTHGTRWGSRTRLNTSKARLVVFLFEHARRAFCILSVWPQLIINKIGLSAPISKVTIFAVVALLAPIGALSSVLLQAPSPVEAAINEQLYFQARLLSAGGSLPADGNYNVQFNIYSGGDGDPGTADESLEYTGSFLVGDSTGGVNVKNGYVSAAIGNANSTQVGTMAGIDWDNDTLWLSINIGNTSSVTPANCDTEAEFNSNCGGDGEMGPFIRLAATPYAFNSAKVGGRAVSELVQLNPGATAQAVNTANSAIAVNQQGAGNLITLQDGGSDIFTIADGGLATFGGNVTITGGTNNGVYYRDASGNLVTTIAGTSGQCLRATTGAAPAFGSCSGTGDIIQGGNSFGTNVQIGAGDAYGIELLVNGATTALTVDTSSNTTLAGDLAVNGGDITSTGDLTITPAGGDVNIVGAANIDGQADVVQLLVQANATQNADIFVVEDSAGNDYFTVQGDGSVLVTSGSISSPGGTQSEQFGASSSAGGSNATALGYLADASGDDTIALGQGSVASSNYAVALGSSALASGQQSIAINDATASATDAIAIGFSAAATTTQGNIAIGSGSTSSGGGVGTVALGYSSTATGDDSVALGAYAVANASRSIAIGRSATSDGYSNSIALGAFATNTANNQIVIGANGNAITDLYLGLGEVNFDAANADALISATSGEGTDVSGADITLAAGRGTGTGLGGAIILQTAPAAGASGAGLNSLVTRLEVQQDGDVAIDTDTLFVDATNNRVGIGNAAPTVALDVTGSGIFSADLTVNGNTTLGDASGDTLTVNGSSITFANGFTSCTVINTDASGVLGCDTNTYLTSASLTLQTAYDGGNSILADNAGGDIDLTVSEATNFSVDITGTGSFLVQDNGTGIFQVLDGGNAYFGSGASSTSCETVSDFASGCESKLGNYQTSTATSNTIIGIDNTLDVTASGTTSAGYIGASNYVKTNGASIYNGDISAVQNLALHSGTNNFNGYVIGGYAGAGLDGSGDVAVAEAGLFEVINYGTGNIGGGFGVFVKNGTNVGGGSITSLGGVVVDNQTTGTNNSNLVLGQNTIPSGNWSIYNSSTANNAIAGNLRIGSTTAPTVALDVTGSGIFSADLTVNGGDLTSTSATFNLLNVTPTTINAFGAATTINIGAQDGTTTLRSDDLIVGYSGPAAIIGAGTAGLTVKTSNYATASTDSGTLILSSGDVSGATSDTGAVTLQSGNSTTSGTTGNVTIQSGNATSGNSGDISIDAGTASGGKGEIFIGTTNAAGLWLARTGVTTINQGSLQVDESTNLNGNTTIGDASGDTLTVNGSSITFANGFTSCTAINTDASGVLGCDTNTYLTSASLTLQTAYVGGNTITATDAEGSLTVTLSEDTDFITNITGTGGFYVQDGGVDVIAVDGSAVSLDQTTINIGTSVASAINIGSGSATTTIAGSSILLNSATLQRTAAGTTNLDLVDGANTTLALINSGAGVANLTVDGAITSTGLITGQAGLTVTGAAVSLNASSNFATNINTGTSTGAVNIASGTGANAIAIGNSASTTTVLGVTNINTTGTAATTIGNSTGTLALLGGNSTNLVVGNGANTTTLNFTAPSGNNTITFPAASGTVQLAPASGSYLVQVPTTTAANTVTPTTNSVVGLTVNGTSGTAATALNVVQAGAATGLNITSSTTGTGQTIGLTNTSGTQTAGLSITRSGAGGTTTSLLSLVQSGGTATNGILFTGTIGTDITTASNRALTIDSNGTGAVTIGGGTGVKTLNFGTGGTGAKTINIGGTAANVIGIGNTQTAGSISLGAAMTSGTITIGGTGLQTGTIGIGTGTGAQAINLGTGGTGAKTVTVGSTASTGVTTIQAGSGGIALNNAIISNNAATVALFNTTPTTVNAFGAATTISLGAGTGTTTVNNDLSVNGGDFVTNQTTFNLINTTATTLNIGGAATTLELGASTGTTSVNNNLTVDGTIANTVTVANTGGANTINVTLGNDADADAVYGLQVNATSAATGDADTLGGILIDDLVSADATVSEYALVIGQGWDSQLYFSDTTSFITLEDTGVLTVVDGSGSSNTLFTITDAGTVGNVGITGSLQVDGNTTIGNANTDTLTINAGTSGTGITFADSSFQNCVLTTSAAGVLTCNSGTVATSLQSAYVGGNTITATDAEGDIALTVSEATSFTVDITGTGTFAVKDGGATVFQIDSAGATTVANDFTVDTNTLFVDSSANMVGIGTLTNDAGKLAVSGATGGSLNSLATFYATSTSTSSSDGVYSYLYVNPGSSSTASYYALEGLATSDSTNLTTNNDLAGVRGAGQYTGTGTLNYVGGGVFDVGNTSSGTINTAYGTWVQNAVNSGGGAITYNIGSVINNQTSGTNNTNLRVGDSNVTGNWSIYNSSTYNNAFAGNLTLAGTSAPTANLSFDEGANRTINVIGRSTNAAGNGLTVSAGNAGTGGSAFSGGVLTLQGGNAAGTGNANGGNVVLQGGTGTGTGTQGLVVVTNVTFSTSSTQTCGVSCTIAQANVDATGAVVIDATASALDVTLPDPSNTTAGRVIYVTAANGSEDFTLLVNGGGQGNEIAMRANTTATMIWNGTDWTAAGASSSTTLQAAYDNTLTSAGGAEIVLSPSGGNADGLTIRNNGTTPIIGGIFEVQSEIGTNLFSVNNNSAEFAANGGAETSSTFSSDWTAAPGGGTVTRNTNTTYVATGQASSQVDTTGANHGLRNNLSANLTPNTDYTVSFAGKLASGTFTTLEVLYSRDGGTSTVACSNYSGNTLITTGWTKITCTISTDGTTATNPDLIIRQSDGTSRTFYIDNLSVKENDTNSVPDNVQIGGGINGGPVTLFTLDRASSPPVANGNQTYLGSMYYDTTSGRIQCYEADGWGACGSAPNNYVNLTPEYPGSVLNGSGVGTMTADFCANESGVLQVNTSFCGAGEALNYYAWTSPQATQQTYSIYITYQLPAAFKSFDSDSTVTLTARTDDTTNGAVTYEMFRREGGAITACGSETTVTSTPDTWQTVGINGNELSGCGFSSASADDFVIFKINMKANSNANVYASTLSFTTIGQ